MAEIAHLIGKNPVKDDTYPPKLERTVRALPAMTVNDRLHELIATAIDGIGQPEFAAALAAICETASGYDSSFIAAFFRNHPPVELFDNLTSDASDTTIEPYLEFAYLLDPFHDLFRRGIGDNVVTLAQWS